MLWTENDVDLSRPIDLVARCGEVPNESSASGRDEINGDDVGWQVQAGLRAHRARLEQGRSGGVSYKAGGTARWVSCLEV